MFTSVRGDERCDGPGHAGLLAISSASASVRVLHELAHLGLVCVTCFERTPLLRLTSTGLSWVSVVILDAQLASPRPAALISSLRSQMDCPVLMLSTRGSPLDANDHGADGMLNNDGPLGPQLQPWLDLLICKNDVIECSGLRLNRRTQQASWHGSPLPLTRQQFRLLWRLCDAAGAVVPLADLSDAVYEGHTGSDRQRVMAHVRRIRQLIEPDPRHPQTLHAVRGVGFRLARAG